VKACLYTCLVTAAQAVCAETGVLDLLRRVETRYNGARTMQAGFEQSLAGQGRITRTERGELHLQRPGKMRWDYSSPAGKLLLVDGKHVYYYNPATRKAEWTPVRESGDLRVPLAFLIGRVDFQRDFKEFRSRREGDFTHVVAMPKSEKAPYREVEFTVTAQAEIRRVRVTGQDGSVMGFRFDAEKLNPRMAEEVFQFALPPGAVLVEGQER